MKLMILVGVFLLQGLLMHTAQASCPEGTILAKKTFLDQDKRQARRLILEPGTVLKCTGEKGKRLVVQTPTGITGTIKKSSVHILSVNSFKLAYPVTAFKSDSNNKIKWFYPGEFYPFEEDEDGNYVLSIGEAIYSIASGKYIVNTYGFILPNGDLEKFNFVDYQVVEETSFPEWRKIKDSIIDFEQQWGCGKSISRKLTAAAQVKGSLSAGGGLLSWVTAKFGFEASAGGDIEITKEKKDEKLQHTLTYWDLISNNDQSALTIAVERYHSCQRGSDEPINYKFHFPGKEFEEVIIDTEWAKRYKFQDGGAVPIRLSGIDDFFKFNSSLTEHYNLSGEFSDAIRDFVIFSAVNIR